MEIKEISKSKVFAKYFYINGDTDKIDSNIYLSDAVIMQGNTGFITGYITICKRINDYKSVTRIFSIVSGEIETIKDLRKYFVLQLAYKNILFDNGVFKYSYEVIK